MIGEFHVLCTNSNFTKIEDISPKNIFVTIMSILFNLALTFFLIRNGSRVARICTKAIHVKSKNY